MNEIYSIIKEKYARLQKLANAKRNKYLDILNNDEEYIKIKHKLDVNFLELAKAEYTNDKTAIKELENHKNVLCIERENVLKRLNIKKSYLIPHYTCEKCKDTGYIDGKPCECYKKYYNEALITLLNISKQNLHSFSEDKYGKEIIIICKKYCDTFPDVKNLVLYGKTGTGKSFLAECISSELQSKNFSVIFVNSTTLFNSLRDYHYSFDKKFNLLDVLTSCDLLVIDDLGVEPMIKNVTNEYLLSIISTRLENNKKIIITTNLNREEILNRYDIRLASRLFNQEVTNGISFNKAQDLRIKDNKY